MADEQPAGVKAAVNKEIHMSLEQANAFRDYRVSE